MLLVLRILSYRNEPASLSAPAQFSMAGGTIGRSPANDLVLDDPGKYISRTHARIQFRDGQFYLADLGSNPSVVNDRPLGIGREVALAAGDQLVIGEYQIEVQVTAPSADATRKADADPLALGSPAQPAPQEVPVAALPLFEPPPPRQSVLPPPLDVFDAPRQPAASPGEHPPAGMRDPLAGASILGNSGPDKRSASQADPLGLNLFGAPSDGRPVGAGVAGDDPLGLAFRGSASDHAAPERYAMPAAPTSPPAAPASPWAAGGIPEDYDPMADFLPKAQPWPAATPVLPATAPAMPAAAAPQSSAAPRATTTSLPNHLDVAQRSPAPGQPNGYAAAQPPAVPRPAVTASAAPPGHDATLEALLRGLDLPDLQTKHTGPELAELVGALLREATAGAMQTLMARSVTKRESRIERTMIGSQANNPLKFFPDPGSALSQMLSKTTGGYMKPVRAFSNAFEDLQAHELAVMAGMHAALSSILARFDPAAIEKRLEVPTVMDKMMASSRKAKMWDRLVLLYADISREADDDFQRLFGESFANAYEEQIERLHGREK